MHRICFHIGGVEITWFGVMMVLGFFAGLGNWVWQGRRVGRDSDACSDLLLWVMVSGIVGARLAYVVSDPPYFLENPIRIILVNQGGLIFYGGLIGGMVGLILFARSRKQSVVATIDFVITSLPLGHAFGRVGCFLNGCCYGSRHDGWPAVTYPPESFPAQGQVADGLIGPYSSSLGVHPVQLYEAAANVAVFLLLAWFYRGRRRDGQVIALYLTTYPVVRFIAEFFRGDERVMWRQLTVAQEVSIVLFIVGVAAWIWSARNPVVASPAAERAATP